MMLSNDPAWKCAKTRYRIFKLLNRKNRAYVIDNRGNKVFYGTLYRCKRFIAYMEGGPDRERDIMDARGKALSESLVSNDKG